MSTINPTGEQLGLLRKSSKQGPFVMVNLLKFKSEGRRSGETGRESYERYTGLVEALLRKAGGRLLWLGSVDQVFIGLDSDGFDHVMLVEYPSRQAFLQMVSSPEYLEANQDREAGLERTVLLAADPLFSRFGRKGDQG
ncbi:MAG TPA: DUF1330 domain-containing protein [Deltaproteobacteria bacterium]|jgi:uncharacterized protein (DUF1330 family)|nr:DUF1330 domain-containing protein [Deltaproteobacteria bacterium]HOI07262.1 DUF1330 domain-containing protein [Deltaproteobacteria bacterium]